MSLKEQIDTDLIEAMKAHNEETLSVLRMLKTAIKNLEIQKKADLEEADVLQVIGLQIKSRRDSVDLYTKGNRPELAQKESAEIKILEKYLPDQMGEPEVHEIVKKAMAETGASSPQDMGRVMGKIMPELKGKADGADVKVVVDSLFI